MAHALYAKLFHRRGIEHDKLSVSNAQTPRKEREKDRAILSNPLLLSPKIPG